MKKILIITNHSYMLYRFRRELIEELMKDSEVVLCMPFVGHEDDFKHKGLRCIETNVDRRGINPKTDWKLMRTYYQMLKAEKPDMVVTYSIKPNIYAGLACGMLHIPFCANVQGLGTAFQKPALAKFVTILYRIAFRNVQTVFFENDVNAAAEKLHEAGAAFVLDLVGFFEDEYKEKVGELQEKGIAVFHGFREEPRPFYAAADCIVMPSYHEGMSNVNLEAAATGRVVITTDIPGCREAVEDGKTGILCQKKSAESLYGAMRKVLGMTKEERIAMGREGRRKMEKEFEKSVVVKKTVAGMRL